LSSLNDFTVQPPVFTNPTTSILAVPRPSQMVIQTSQDGMGAVQAAVLAFGLEWLSALIPFILLLVITVCCYRQKKKNNSSQTDLPLAEVRPEPVGEAQNQVLADQLVINNSQTDPAEQKDFILVIDEQ
jgi:hypothetical protein